MTEELSEPRLPAVGLAARLSDEDRDLLSSYGEFHFAEPGKTLIEQGLPHGKLFFVISGLLHAKRKVGDQEILLGPIPKGEWFGEVDLFLGGGAAGSVVAIETAQYWFITREDLEQYMGSYPKAGLQMMIGLVQVVSGRLRGLTDKLTEKTEMAALLSELKTGPFG